MCLTPGSTSTNRLNQPFSTGSLPPSASHSTQPTAVAGRSGSLPNASMSDLDGQVELERSCAVAVRQGAAREVGLAERDVPEHLLGEANA